jgi:exodeoxyribonuclease VII large subunit
VRASHRHHLQRTAADVAGGASVLRRQSDALDRMGSDIAGASRQVLDRHATALSALEDWFSAIDLDGTLRRGFSIVSSADGKTVIKSAREVAPGDRLRVRFADGTVAVEVIER